MYKLLIKPIFFLFDPEKVHHFTFSFLKLLFRIPGVYTIVKGCYATPQKPVKAFGLTFPNCVGLAAGFDKDAKLIEPLSAFGFGFIEIGTLTPKPQQGNDKPRLFRLIQDEAIINRMGFNNEGIESAIQRLKKTPKGIIVGGNIGKNKLTPNESADNDYVQCFTALFPYIDYFVVNVSSPNTPNLRALQEKEPLKNLLDKLVELNLKHESPKPILLKIAPDLSDSQLDDIVEIVELTKIQGLIVSNTTIDRSNLTINALNLKKIGIGGLSGKPLTNRSTKVIKYIHQKSGGKIEMIGVGGIYTAKDAQEKLDAGAKLVQVYTGFIYEGPGIVKKILSKMV